MAQHIIGRDITLMRKFYDEALSQQGVPCKYQYPLMPASNDQGESVVDSYSDILDTYIFFDGNPKMKTFKRYGWVVENDKDLPFLVHCSFNLPELQKDCIFAISGHYTGVPDRKFRVTELTCDLVAPDHMVCQVVPVYGDNVVGRTKKEVEKTFNTSNHFLKPQTNYRGDRYVTEEDD